MDPWETPCLQWKTACEGMIQMTKENRLQNHEMIKFQEIDCETQYQMLYYSQVAPEQLFCSDQQPYYLI